ncbi:MAG TPA: DUF4132 domain-containing protein [Phycisphaerae bacterium]|nr:DUF4132 domain-containing protein [Phycisphaerae bacterium]
MKKLAAQAPGNVWEFKDIQRLSATTEILEADSQTQVKVVLLIFDQIARIRDRLGPPTDEWDGRYANLQWATRFPRAAVALLPRLLSRKVPFCPGDFVHMAERTAHLERISTWTLPHLNRLLTLLERHVQDSGMSPQLDKAVLRMGKALEWVGNAPERKLGARLARLRAGPAQTPLEPGEAWSDRALEDIDAMPNKRKMAWCEFLAHCQKASGGKPTGKWRAEAEKLLSTVGWDRFGQRVLQWFPSVDKPRTEPVAAWSEWEPDPNQLIIDPHADILRGLAWCCGFREDRGLARALTALAISAYRKVPRLGPRAVRVGNACVWALGNMPGMEGLGQLALLKVRVKFGTAQKGIEKALSATAQRVGLPRDELEEMAVPAYGLSEVGLRRERLDDYTAELRVTGTASTELAWIRPDGKRQKSVPASVKKNQADDLAELKRAAKDIQKMLPAQRERIDQLHLQQKSWPYDIWRQRYLDHPLLGTIARRLIWRFSKGKRSADGIFWDGRIASRESRELEWLGTGAHVELWHPIGNSSDNIRNWRRWLEDHQVRQPFKQAHREVYLLTDAERQTRVYSNRFAAHILRQHQFNALCAARGWKNKLRLLVDDEYPPASLSLPKWNLRAEFWVEGAGEDYGTDTNEAGVYHCLATDQVRFYPIDAAQRRAHAGGGGYYTHGLEGSDAPILLADVPSLVLSEVMRDVDLFVGVASVGNDPGWADGGPDGRYREYWTGYAFGQLSETAQTRKQVLERLIPRLKIAGQCSFLDRFLVVRGQRRTYKIHLGSGNVLMQPDDQYLCIVPGRSAADRPVADKLHLPFEGDRTLPIVLSKALLLAEDHKIKDETILSQIGART